MSAIDTATRILNWAITAPSGKGQSPPRGGFLGIEQLADPPPMLRDALGQLTIVTAARLRFDTPLLQDTSPIGLGALVLAVTIGVAYNPELAQFLLQAIPDESIAPVEWVTRYGLVTPALRFLPEAIAKECRLASPLTSALSYPVAGQENQALIVIRRLIASKVERAALTQYLAQPSDDVAVRQWRREVFNRLRLGTETDLAFVLDVYESMMIHHSTAAIAQVRASQAVLTRANATRDDRQLNDALSVANYWQPLWAIERSHNEALRLRRYLGYDYRQGLNLYRLSQRLTGGLT